MTDASTAASDAPPVRRSGGKPLLILVLLAVLSSLGWWGWRRWSTPEPVAATPQPAAPATATAAPADSTLADLKSQLSDLDRVNAVLRQQVLALTERVRVLGDQVTTLQQQPHPASAETSGPAPVLALADQWLALAQARYELFDDPPGALQALEAADHALARARDPRVLSLRQTLAIEREALRALPQTDTMAVSGQLLAWQQASGGWPLRQDGQATATAGTAPDAEGWLTRLDRWFTVRPLEADVAPMRLSDGRTLVAAELAWARLLLVRGESAELKRTLDRLVDTVVDVYDATDEGVATALEGMRTLSAKLPGGARQVRLGAALNELRGFVDGAATDPTAAPAEAPPAESSLPAAAAPEVPEQPVEPAAAAAVDDGSPT